jgi:hypothetical protein
VFLSEIFVEEPDYTYLDLFTKERAPRVNNRHCYSSPIFSSFNPLIRKRGFWLLASRVEERRVVVRKGE